MFVLPRKGAGRPGLTTLGSTPTQYTAKCLYTRVNLVKYVQPQGVKRPMVTHLDAHTSLAAEPATEKRLVDLSLVRV